MGRTRIARQGSLDRGHGADDPPTAPDGPDRPEARRLRMLRVLLGHLPRGGPDLVVIVGRGCSRTGERTTDTSRPPVRCSTRSSIPKCSTGPGPRTGGQKKRVVPPGDQDPVRGRAAGKSRPGPTTRPAPTPRPGRPAGHRRQFPGRLDLPLLVRPGPPRPGRPGARRRLGTRYVMLSCRSHAGHRGARILQRGRSCRRSRS